MIIIIEDDAIARRALQILVHARGYESQAVPSAEEALPLLRARNLEMLLIDIDLPGMSGFELLRRVQHDYPAIPCMLMSANDHVVARRNTTRPVPFFLKPLNLGELFSQMANQRTCQPA